MTTTAASPFLSDAAKPQYVDGPAARYAGLAGRGSLSASTSRSSSARRGRATIPPPNRWYVLHFLVGPAFAAQTLAAHLAYGTLVGGFFSLAG